jgi:hypothetical protein
MSTPTPASNLPTRQQLDEIDALLRRMLSLPSLAGEPSAAPPASPPTTASVSFPTPTVREIPPPHPPAAGEPAVQSWRVEWPQQPAPQPTSMAAWGAPVHPGPENPRWPASAQVHQPTPPIPFGTPVAATPVAPALPVESANKDREIGSVFHAVLALSNGTFNLITYLLGPLGAYLRGPGRNLLGWIGIAMVVAAGAWAVGEWYGCDWPRPDFSKIRLPR